MTSSTVANDEGEPDEVARSVEQARRLVCLVARGTISLRDASLWAGLAGLKALPERKVDAAEHFGIGARQASNIERAVQRLVDDSPSVASSDPSLADPLALTAAEVELAADRHRAEALRAVESLRARKHGEQPRRTGENGATPGDARTRQHRLARPIAARAGLLSHAPDLSLSRPYLAVPWALPEALLDLVPPAQRRRSGRPPEEGWLMGIVRELNTSYLLRDGRAPQLAAVVTWAFGRFGSSPSPLDEAHALGLASSVAREAGQMRAYWLAQRAVQLAGPHTPTALYVTLNSCITLRNHSFVTEANALIRSALRRTHSPDFTEQERHAIRESLLSQAQYNLSHGFVGPLSPTTVDAARRVADRLVDSSTAVGASASTGLRARFEAEFARARLRAAESGERFWLHADALAAFEDAERAITAGSEVMYKVQWELLRMAVGLNRRDLVQVTAGADSFRRIAEANPWVVRDHPSEVHQYGVYTERARAWRPEVSALLAWNR